MKKQGTFTFILLAGALALSSCATHGYKKSPFLGRLGDYKPASHNPEILQFKTEKVDLSNRKKLSLEPVTFYYKRGQDGPKMTDDHARLISKALTNSLADKLSDKFRLGANENNDSLVIKLALVNIVPPEANTSVESDSTRIIPADLHNSRLEMKFLDSAAKMQPMAGLTIPVGETIPTMTGGYTSWPVLNKAIDAWTTELTASINDFSRPVKKDDDK